MEDVKRKFKFGQEGETDLITGRRKIKRYLSTPLYIIYKNIMNFI